MEELVKCLEIKKEINKLDGRIEELRSRILSPKNQIITGMPRGGGGDNAIESYLLKLEEREQEKERLLNNQQEQWDIALSKFRYISIESIELMYFRFIEGMPWKKCVIEVNKKYKGMTINKAFRIYGKINENF